MTQPQHLRALVKLKRAGIACACLEHVLESKKQSGRKKDRAFLKLLAAATAPGRRMLARAAKAAGGMPLSDYRRSRGI
jgi:hypothetical protein